MKPHRLVFAAIGVFAPIAIAAACDDTSDDIRRTTTPEDDGAIAVGDGAPLGDASADADAGADADIIPGTRAIATGAGPHDDPTIGYGDHTCAIAGVDRDVYCWGANDHGQLGIGIGGDGGISVDAPAATQLVTDETGLPFAGADEISLAAWHSCARSGTALFCWGQRFSGAQAEPPSAINPDRVKPRAISLVVGNVAAGGPHTCILEATGKIACFGHSYFNELGRVNADDQPCDAPIFYAYPGYDSMVGHKCSGDALETNGTITDFKRVVSGELHSCGLADGHVYCWGTNFNGELGVPFAGTSELNAQQVVTDANLLTPLSDTTAIASAGGKHTCAIADGHVLCWGSNASAEIGADPAAITQRPNAAAVAGADGATAIGAGDGVSCAVMADATAVCWGADDVGQLGDGVVKASSFAPVAVKGPLGTGRLTNVTAIAPGRRHVCALRSDATVWCWGKNDRGQLGDGTSTDSLYPVKVKGLPE